LFADEICGGNFFILFFLFRSIENEPLHQMKIIKTPIDLLNLANSKRKARRIRKVISTAKEDHFTKRDIGGAFIERTKTKKQVKRDRRSALSTDPKKSGRMRRKSTAFVRQ
jgi:hypothetical protein